MQKPKFKKIATLQGFSARFLHDVEVSLPVSFEELTLKINVN